MVQSCWLCAWSLSWAHQLVSSPPLTWHGCYRTSVVVLVVFRNSVHLCQAPSSGLMASSPSSGHCQLLFSPSSSSLGPSFCAPQGAGPFGLMSERHVLAYFPVHLRCLLRMTALESQHHFVGLAWPVQITKYLWYSATSPVNRWTWWQFGQLGEWHDGQLISLLLLCFLAALDGSPLRLLVCFRDDRKCLISKEYEVGMKMAGNWKSPPKALSGA